jgi:hypothetical protein
MATTEKSQIIQKSMTRLRLWSKKESIIETFSLEGCKHIHELTEEETDRLIEWLTDQADKSDKMRKRMLSIGYQLHWDKPRTEAEQMMDAKRINYNHVNSFLEKDTRSKIKKAMNSMNPYELADALVQLEEILKATKNQVKKYAAKQ